MQSFKAGLVGEWLLLMYRKKTIGYLIVSALLPIALALSLQTLQPVLGLLAVSPSFSIEMLDVYTLFWIPLFIFLTVSDLFPNEIAARTLKLALLRPISRLQLFLAKLSTLGLGIGLLLALLGLVTLLCGIVSGNPGNAADWAGNAKAYIAAYLAMLALASVFVCFAQFFRSAVGCLVGSIVLYGAAKLMPFFFRSFSAFSPSAYTDWHMLWLGNAVAPVKLAVTTLFLVSCCILFSAIGYFMFDRKEA